MTKVLRTWRAPPSLRSLPSGVGLHAGPVVERDGDVFGATVNVAARLAAHAHAGELLTTARTAVVFGGRDDVMVCSLGELTFKNFAGAGGGLLGRGYRSRLAGAGDGSRVSHGGRP